MRSAIAGRFRGIDGDLLRPLRVSRLTAAVLLLIVLSGALALRLWTLDTPALDRTAWKEIDYIEISRNYWQHGFRFWEPEITWPAEPPRVTAMEFPLVPYLAALVYALFGFHPWTVRLLAIVAHLLMAVNLFRLTRRELGASAAVGAAWAASVFAWTHEFGQMLFSEPLMIACSVGALYHFAEWVDFRRTRDAAWSTVLFSLAVALKLEPLFLLLPLSYLAFRRWRLHWPPYRAAIGMFTVALILPGLWYSYAFYLSRTSIDVFGVVPFLQGHDKLQTLTMLSDAEWYRIMFWRIAGLVGGKIGLLLLAAGLAASFARKGSLSFWVYGASVGCYFAIVAEGQIDAPYRQMNAIPPLAAFVGLGAEGIASLGAALFRMVSGGRRIPDTVTVLGLLALISLIPFRRAAQMADLDPMRPVHGGQWELAQVLRRHATPAGKLVTAGEYTIHRGGNDLSPVIYYYAGMQGWSLQRPEWDPGYVAELIRRGATHFVAVDMDREPDAQPFLRLMRARFRLLHESGNGFILDLRQPLAATGAPDPSPEPLSPAMGG
jgi:4-amino-4-deoxy-L-arabinose transferase-like glycosyltransferase